MAQPIFKLWHQVTKCFGTSDESFCFGPALCESGIRLPQGDPQQDENARGHSGRLLPPREGLRLREVGKGPPWRPWRAAVGRAYLAEIERPLLPVGSGSR